MDLLSDKVVIPFMVTLLAGIVLAIIIGIFKIVTRQEIWDDTWPRLKTWYNKIRLYSRLSGYERDILKAIHDTKATRLSRHYDDGRPPSIQTKLDCILETPVACRLVLSSHYDQSLRHLSGYGFIRGDERWLYEEFTRETYRTDHYQLTYAGYDFIQKYAVGLNWRERFIRKWLRGLSKHQYEGCYYDGIGEEVRGKFPNLLQGLVFPKRYIDGQWVGSSDGPGGRVIHIYQYPQGVREDDVEWVVTIRYPNAHDPDIAQDDSVFLLIHTDEYILKREEFDAARRKEWYIKEFQSGASVTNMGIPHIFHLDNRAFRPPNKPQHLEFDPRVVGLWEDYPVRAEVVSIEVVSIKQSDDRDRLVKVLNLGSARPFDPSVEHERNQSAER